MSWYRAGSVTVTNGSNIVTGAGTDFVANASIGEAFIGPDGRSYEIGQIVSATDLRLTTTYQAATGGGQTYAIQPTQSFARDLALAAAALLATFAEVRDNAGKGLFPAGVVATPGVRFQADQDTGLYLSSPNVLGIAAGGVSAATFLPTRADFTGHIKLVARKAIGFEPDTQTWSFAGGPAALYGMTVGVDIGAGGPATIIAGYGGVIFGTAGVEKGRIDQAGNLLIGAASGTSHVIGGGGSVGDQILQLSPAFNPAFATARFFLGDNRPISSALSCMKLDANASTGRSLNAAGTVNVSGADYAEYMVKAQGCGIIAKGDVCGVDRDGLLTRIWGDAISFVVKSTDPSLVGGDTWAAHLAERPGAPGLEPESPILPAPPAEDADEALREAYRDDLAEYPVRIAAQQAAHAAWASAKARYEADLPVWEADLEAARQRVDRIAFCGQVPCNVTGDFDVGDYIVAVANGAGIKAVAVKPDDMTIVQYMRRVGKVWAIRDGRAWIDVQHG